MSEKLNAKVQDAINETLLKAAFEQAAEEELAAIEAIDVEIPTPTAEQQKEIEKAFKKHNRKTQGTSRIWRAVAMIALVFSITASVIMIQPTVRASVWDFVVSFCEKYLSFDFDKEEPQADYKLGDYTVTYIPDGFVCKDAQSSVLNNKLIFVKGDENIWISLYPTAIYSSNADVENGESEKIKVGEYDGYLVRYSNRDLLELLFGDEKHTIAIRATISDKEIKKIAENIK